MSSSSTWRGFDRFLITRRGDVATRACPFCSEEVQDPDGNETNFIIHLGTKTAEHLANKNWEKYIKRINATL